MDLLELVETLRAEEASRERLFGGEGTAPRRARRGPGYDASLLEATRLVADVTNGKRPFYRLQEAMTTSDFPLLFGDIIDRQMLARYAEYPSDWQEYARIGRVRDFRLVRRFSMDGGEAVLTPVAEQAPYPEAALTEGRYSYGVAKYGRQMPFSWESNINDDLDAIKDIPTRLARAARRTEYKFATALFAAASGPNGTFFAAGNKNQVITANGASANNPPLTISGLTDALNVAARIVDADGEPIFMELAHLVVPPSLEVQARNILNAQQIWLTTAQGAIAGQQMNVDNWLRSRVRLHVNPYLPIISSTANGFTSWYVFADPGSARPAFEVGYLLGHETPETFMAEANAVRLGGGGAGPLDGDFDHDTIRYKIRHVIGGVLLDPKAAVASNGSGV